MRAKLKLNVIKQARTVKNKNMQRQPKIPVKVHRYPKGKPCSKTKGETSAVARLKNKINRINRR
jgi:hypothetical protein